MLKRYLAALFLLVITGCADPAPESVAQEPTTGSPQAFLNEIYGHYADKGAGAGIDIAAPGIIERYFTPDLAQLIIADRDRAKAANDVPALNGDPFLGSQEWQVSELAIAIAKSADPDKTRAFVKFKNYDQPVAVQLDLQHGLAGWQIAEIDWGDTTLSKILQE